MKKSDAYCGWTSATAGKPGKSPFLPLTGGVALIISAVSGFWVPFYREVERLGRRWVDECVGVTRLASPHGPLGRMQDDPPACHGDAHGTGRG